MSKAEALKYFDENKRWYNEFTEHWFYFFDISEEEIRDSISLWEEIGEDLANSTNKLEGTYESGDTIHGSYLRWSEKSGFVWLVVNKCNGGPMQIIEGRVLVTPISVKFIPEKTKGGSSSHSHHNSKAQDREYLFVKWRDVGHLIEPEDISKFADYTAGLNYSTIEAYENSLAFFSKVLQPYKGSANELPVFPAGYESFVKKPFQGKIISIGKTYRRAKPEQLDDEGKPFEENYDDLVTEVKLDIGKSSGITPGVFIRFAVGKDDYTNEGLVIKKVFDKYSIAEYKKNIPKKDCRKGEYETCEAEEGRKLNTGQKFSTTGEL